MIVESTQEQRAKVVRASTRYSLGAHDAAFIDRGRVRSEYELRSGGSVFREASDRQILMVQRLVIGKNLRGLGCR